MKDLPSLCRELLAAGEKATKRPWSWGEYGPMRALSPEEKKAGRIEDGDGCVSEPCLADLFHKSVEFTARQKDTTFCVLAANHVEALAKKYLELEKFILARCCCKSIPGQRACSYCEAVHGVEEW